MMSILNDIRAEIQRAEEKHGPLPISVPSTFTLREVCAELERTARAEIDSFEQWSPLAILAEEVGEAARAETTADLRAELVQVVAVGIRWIGQIDGLSAADCIPPQIVSTPDTIGGAPRIDGTRIPASLILAMLAAGRSEAEIIADFHGLTPVEIKSCIAYAAKMVDSAANPSIMEALGLPADDPPANAVEQIRRLREKHADLLAISDAYQHMHTRAVRSEARLSALLAPAEGVDLEEVLMQHQRVVSEAMNPLNTGPVPDGIKLALVQQVLVVPALAHEVAHLRDLCRRLLPPRYIAADGQVMDPALCAPHAPDCAECGRGRARAEECLGVLPTPAEDVAHLRARLAEVERERDNALADHRWAIESSREAVAQVTRAAQEDIEQARAGAQEMRLTLAAEQGRAEGRESSARAAMLAADKAQEKS